MADHEVRISSRLYEHFLERHCLWISIKHASMGSGKKRGRSKAIGSPSGVVSQSEHTNTHYTGTYFNKFSGSSASGCCAIQIAKLAGLKIIAVVDVARSGARMLRYGADLLVDRFDTTRAVEIIKTVTKGKLRFGLDTVGRDSAAMIAEAMQPKSENGLTRGHLVGLTAVPKVDINGVMYHSVPIKAFHEAPEIGEGMMIWLEKLLERNLWETLDTVVAEGGLEGINAALDRLRDGSVNGPRMVVPLKK